MKLDFLWDNRGDGSGINAIYRGEYDFYLLVRHSDITRKHQASDIACVFDGDLKSVISDSCGGNLSIYKAVCNDIAQNGPFYLDGFRQMPRHKNKETLGRALHRLRYGSDTRVSLKVKDYLSDAYLGEIQELAQMGCAVQDYSFSNLAKDDDAAIMNDNRVVYQNEYGGLSVQRGRKRYDTAYSAELQKKLESIWEYNLQPGGYLITQTAGVNSQIAELIYLFASERVPSKLYGVDLEIWLAAQHRELMKDGLSVDHLSGSKYNNYPTQIALINKDINGALQNRRNRIRRPYFFFTSVDHRNKLCKVRCGVDGYGWERFFAFGELTDLTEARKYLECFNDFARHLPEEYYAKGRIGNKNLLTFWSDSKRMERDDNPLNLLAKKSHDKDEYEFVAYESGAFDDMPVV